MICENGCLVNNDFHISFIKHLDASQAPKNANALKSDVTTRFYILFTRRVLVQIESKIEHSPIAHEHHLYFHNLKRTKSYDLMMFYLFRFRLSTSLDHFKPILVTQKPI